MGSAINTTLRPSTYLTIFRSIAKQLGFSIFVLSEECIDVSNDNVRFCVHFAPNDGPTKAKQIIEAMALEAHIHCIIAVKPDKVKPKKTEKKPKTIEALPLTSQRFKGPIGRIDDYYVYPIAFKGKTCPYCRKTTMKANSYNVPAFNSDGQMQALFLCDLWYCEHCKRYIMTQESWQDLTKRVEEEQKWFVLKAINTSYSANSQPKEIPPQNNSPKIRDFYVKDAEYPFCPVCESFHREKKLYNVPVYTPDNHFLSYYLCKLTYCFECKTYTMSNSEWNKLLARMTQAKFEYRVKPKNMKYVSGSRSTGYLYAPIANMPIHVNMPQRKHFASSIYDDSLSWMNKTSFLSDAGYRTNVPLYKRREILREQVQIHGKRKVVDFIRGLIRLREGRPNMEHAISIWQSDLDYIAKL